MIIFYSNFKHFCRDYSDWVVESYEFTISPNDSKDEGMIIDKGTKLLLVSLIRLSEA